MEQEISQLEDLKVYSETAGAEYIKKTTKEVVENNIDNLVNNYKTLSHTEMIALCASISANLSLYQLLTGIKDQIEVIKELHKTE